MKLIVGLGNPGKEYARTRHNVGFRVIDRLSEKLGAPLDRSKFKGEYGTAELALGSDEDDGKLLLVKPQTYMNLSGETVVGFSGYFKIALKDILVVVDDVELPLGAIRMRREGSPGTHNGLKNISLRLGSNEYARLRLGVGGREAGAERQAQDLAGHVLSRFSEPEEEALKTKVDLAVDACIFWAQKGIDAAMNKYNVAEKKKKKQDENERGS